jgi:HD superfamily phosphodiesterase
MITQDIIDQIQEYAVFIDWNVAFEGKAKENRHLSRVVTIAKFLAEKAEKEGVSREICEAGAWLHDIGLMVGNDDDPAKIRVIAEEFLSHLSLDDESKRRIADCVETHEGAREAVSIEAKIVHDADVLDKMGLLGVIRHTWKIVNLIKPDASPVEVFFTLQKHLKERREKLYTTTAKKLLSVLDESLYQFFEAETEAIKTLRMIMGLAKADHTADEIARELVLQPGHQTLMYQLCISDDILQAWYVQEETLDERKPALAGSA